MAASGQKSVRASVSVTGSTESVTIDHCLWCQFKLSPWKRQSKVQSKTFSSQIVAAASVCAGFSG